MDVLNKIAIKAVEKEPFKQSDFEDYSFMLNLSGQNVDDKYVILFAGFYPILIVDENENVYINSTSYTKEQDKILEKLKDVFSEIGFEEIKEREMVKKLNDFDKSKLNLDYSLLKKKFFTSDLVRIEYKVHKFELSPNEYFLFGKKLLRPTALSNYFTFQ